MIRDLEVSVDYMTSETCITSGWATLLVIENLEQLELLQAQLSDAVNTIRNRTCRSYDVQRHKVEPLCCWNGHPDSCEYCAREQRP